MHGLLNKSLARLLLTAAWLICTAPFLALGGCTELSVGVNRPTPLTRFIQLSGAYKSVTYRLMPGDQVTMRCYYNPQVAEDLLVRPDGNISLSLVGEIHAAGRTAEEL